MPKGWTEISLGSCFRKSTAIDPRKFSEETFDLYSVPSYTSHVPDRVLGRDIGSTKQKVEEGDVLLCKIVPHIRRAWSIPKPDTYRQIASGEWMVLRNETLEPEFIRRYVLSDSFHERFMQTVSGVGGSLMRARPSEAAKITVPVPPRKEQLSINSKLTSLTAKLDRARNDLDAIPDAVKRFTEVSVEALFDGSLTAEWRSSAEIAKAASDEMLEEAYRKKTAIARRKPAVAPSWSPRMEIPSSWRWVSIDQVVTIVQYGSSKKTSDNDTGVPVLRMGNIQAGRLDWGNLKYLPKGHDEFPDLLLEDGDVLFNRTNSFELVGKSAVYRAQRAHASFASYLIRLRPFAILPELLAAYINSPMGRSWIESVASQQVGQANVNGSKLKELAIPLPPEAEQTEMARLLDGIFKRASHVRGAAERARSQINRLDAAILTKAFSGELIVPGHNDDRI